MTPEQRTLAAAYLAEMWPVCRELPRHHREEKRKNDRRMQREMEEREAVNAASTTRPQESTGCAEIGGEESPRSAA